MPVSVEKFWQLAQQSDLLGAKHCQKLATQFAQSGATADGDAQPLARWLVGRQVLSRYQATVLLAGKPGPFQFGGYQVFDRLSKGRLKGLFRAVHLDTQHVVMLRFLDTGEAANADRLTGAAQRAAGAAAVDDEHATACYQLVNHGPYHFIALESLRGESLAERIASSGPLPPAEACRIAREAALGLVALGRATRNPAYGALRPHNVWLTKSGRAKLMDFPLACESLTIDCETRMAELRETRARIERQEPVDEVLSKQLDYVAPEVLRGAPATETSDVYALGCTLHQALTGQLPHAAHADPAARLAARLSQPPPGIETLDATIPPAIAKLVGYLLAIDPSGRYQAPEHAAEALAPYAADSQPAEPPKPTLVAYRNWLAAPTPAAEQPIAVTTAQPEFPEPRFESADDTASDLVAPLNVEQQSFAAVARQRRAARRRTTAIVLVAAVAALSGALWYLNQQTDLLSATPTETTAAASPDADDASAPGDATAATTNDASSSAGNHSGGAATSATPPRTTGLGDPLWESPTEGDPLELRFLPPGVQVVAAVCIAEFLAHPEAERLLEVLGRWGQPFIDQLTSIAGITTEDIDHALIGLLDASPAPPESVWVITTRDTLAIDPRLEAWGQPRDETVNGENVLVGDEMAYYFPRSEGGRVLVAADLEHVSAVIEADGVAPPLRREFADLLAHSDAERLLTVLFAPSFVTTGGKSVFFADESAQLRQPFADLLGPQASAALISAHLDHDLYLELRIYGLADRTPYEVASALRGRVRSVPSRVSEYLVALAPSPYGRDLLARLPRMVEVAEEYTRIGVEGRQAVLRTYLPIAAAHNLTLAGRVALLESVGSGGVAVATPTAETNDAAGRLGDAYSFSVPRTPLDQAIEQVSSDMGVPIVILGGDLQLEGITRNQSFGLDVADSTFAGVLQEILRLANPDGKLVYVIKPDPDSGDETIYITTRAAAAERGDVLPPEFATDAS